MFPESGLEQRIVSGLSRALVEGAGWMKFLGILSILGGILQVFTIAGIISGGIQIWMGMLLFQSASAAEKAYATGNVYELNAALDKIKTYFVFNGILTLLSFLAVCAIVCLLLILPAMGIMPFLLSPEMWNN